MTPYMTRTELDMIRMEKADLIRYYTLPDGTQGLLVISGGQSINLCEYDDLWMMLTQTADRLYIKTPDACMDEYTEEILERRKQFSDMGRYGYLTSMPRYGDKVLNYGLAAFSESFMGYFLSRIYRDIEIDVSVKEVKGFRSRFSILCKVDGDERYIPCSFTALRSEHRYSFGNIFSMTDTAGITLRYGFGRIEVVTESHTRRELRHEYVYDIPQDTVSHRVMEDGEIIYIDKKIKKRPSVQMTDEEKLICGVTEDDYTGYEMPWGERVFLRADEMIADNGSGLMVQICSEELFDNKRGEIAAVHEIFSRKGRMLVQSDLYCKGLVKSFDNVKSGYYYRYISDDGIVEITDDPETMSAAQMTDKYLYDKKK